MIFSAIILFACTVHLGRCVTLELYSGQQYSGLLKKITYDTTLYYGRKCTQFDETYEVRSLKTDKCVMIYETADCKHIDPDAPGDWTMYSVRVEGNTERFDIDGAYSNRKDERRVQSFHTCTRERGGGVTLDIDIYSGTTYTGDLIASYGGVCGCKNIPSNIVTKGKHFSIDNHGNSIYFFDKEDCTGLQRLILAGDNERSRSVFQLDPRADVIRSFRPVNNLSCPPVLDATVFAFIFFNVSETGGITENVDKHMTTTVTNTRPFPATVYFNTSIPITVKYSVAKAFTYFNTTRLYQPVMDFEEGLTVLLGGNTEALRRSIEANYQYTNSNPSTRTIEVTIPMQDQGSIDMDACKTCELTYNVWTFPISYTTPGAKVKGDDKLSLEQLLDLLPPGMKYNNGGGRGGYVYTTVEGEMRADFFVRDDTKMSCKLAPECKP